MILVASHPEWFGDEDAQDVVKILRGFIIKLNKQSADDRKKPVYEKISPKTCPTYFEFSNSNKREYTISILESLERLTMLSIKRDLYCDDIVKVIFNGVYENILRDWLNMPLISARALAWQEAINSSSLDFVRDYKYSLLLFGCFGIYSPNVLLLALQQLNIAIPKFIQHHKKLSWRQLSAHFFFGDSKYLNSVARREALMLAFADLGCVLKERTIQVSVALACEPTAILFIENWDTHCWLTQSPMIRESFHLVYAAGFKVGARNIRIPENVSFYFSGDYSQLHHFKDYWFSAAADSRVPTFFWGDLDYSGLAILNVLAAQFKNVVAWRPGYEPMLKAIEQGIGHKPEQAEKENQHFVSSVTCEYAQTVLLPALNKTGLMLDQEWLIELPTQIIDI